jgi:hypothetical protein
MSVNELVEMKLEQESTIVEQNAQQKKWLHKMYYELKGFKERYAAVKQAYKHGAWRKTDEVNNVYACNEDYKVEIARRDARIKLLQSRVQQLETQRRCPGYMVADAKHVEDQRRALERLELDVMSAKSLHMDLANVYRTVAYGCRTCEETLLDAAVREADNDDEFHAMAEAAGI